MTENPLSKWQAVSQYTRLKVGFFSITIMSIFLITGPKCSDETQISAAGLPEILCKSSLGKNQALSKKMIKVKEEQHVAKPNANKSPHLLNSGQSLHSGQEETNTAFGVSSQLFHRQHRLRHVSRGIQANACVASGISGLQPLGKQELQEDAKEKPPLFKGVYQFIILCRDLRA